MVKTVLNGAILLISSFLNRKKMSVANHFLEFKLGNNLETFIN